MSVPFRRIPSCFSSPRLDKIACDLGIELSYNDPVVALDAIDDFLRRKPFESFRTATSSGDRYDVRHPELVLRVKNGLYVEPCGRGGVADRAVFISLLHMVAIEAPANGFRKRRQLRTGRRVDTDRQPRLCRLHCTSTFNFPPHRSTMTCRPFQLGSVFG